MIRAGIASILKPNPVASISGVLARTGASTTQFFQSWVDRIFQSTLIDGSWDEPRNFIDRSYLLGVQHADDVLNDGINYSTPRVERVDLVASLMRVELQGIVEAVSQRAVRAVATGILSGLSMTRMLRQIMSDVDVVGLQRTRTMVDVLTTKAFSEATLDVFEAAGVREVGLIPESAATAGRAGRAASGASSALEATSATAATQAAVAELTRPEVRPGPGPSRGFEGPGSRVPRERLPSLRTIQRMRQVERRFERSSWVNVQTAEDDRVCALCDSIAENGPYTINAARSLIPAHPKCRCLFVTARRPRDR